VRTITFVTAALTVVLATPVYAQSVPERTGVNSVLGVAPKTEDFVEEVAVSDMFEIESSKFAQQNPAQRRSKPSPARW
jgi:putative membrane protein